MAATNYTPIQLYNSGTASTAPTNTNLAAGELALNYKDGLLYYKDDANVVQKIGYKLVPIANGGTGTTTAQLAINALVGSVTAGYVVQGNGTNIVLGVPPAVTDTNPIVKGSADATKQMRFEVDGLTTGTTRVITVPNADITIAAAGANADITSLSALTGNVSFTGTGNRITGDFSNATSANRVMFQTSTANNPSTLAVIPNGTSDTAIVSAYGASDATNVSTMSMLTQTTGGAGTTSLRSGILGSGTFLPMTFYTGGSERMRIDTSGNVGVNGPPNAAWASDKRAIEFPVAESCLWVHSTNLNIALASNYYFGVSGKTAIRPGAASEVQVDKGGVFIRMYASAGAGAVLTTVTNQFVIGATDCVMTGALGGLGYGSGAGGTVTQATSKATGVTLSKPTGQITMNNAALAGNTTVTFVVVNSLVTTNDLVVTNQNSHSGDYYQVWARPMGGQFVLSVRNMTAGSLSDAIVINFAIIRGATA